MERDGTKLGATPRHQIVQALLFVREAEVAFGRFDVRVTQEN